MVDGQLETGQHLRTSLLDVFSIIAKAPAGPEKSSLWVLPHLRQGALAQIS